MPVTMEEVHVALDPEEPDYSRARELGSEALPHLAQLVLGPDPLLAAKSAYLAGLIADVGSADIVSQAARSPDPTVRVAAAGAAGHLPGAEGADVLVSLVADEDLGVRKVALNSVMPGANPELRARIERLTQYDSVPRIRELARLALDRLDH